MNLDQEKRLMLAFALSIVMLVLYRVYVIKEQPPEPKKPVAAVTTVPAGQPRPPKATATGAAATTAKSSTPAVLPVLQGSQPEDIVVESKLYRVTFSTQGAVVKSWVLKNYRDAKDQLLDIVDAPACENLGYPLSVNLRNSTLDTSQPRDLRCYRRLWTCLFSGAGIGSALRGCSLRSRQSDLHIQRRQSAGEKAILLRVRLCYEGRGGRD